MIHHARRYSLTVVSDPAALAQLLTKRTWCGCAAFQIGEYLLLNDSFSGDTAQEYAIVRVLDRRQIESITFGWCSTSRAHELLIQVLAGEFDTENYGTVTNRVETCDKHGVCPNCM